MDHRACSVSLLVEKNKSTLLMQVPLHSSSLEWLTVEHDARKLLETFLWVLSGSLKGTFLRPAGCRESWLSHRITRDQRNERTWPSRLSREPRSPFFLIPTYSGVRTSESQRNCRVMIKMSRREAKRSLVLSIHPHGTRWSCPPVVWFVCMLTCSLGHSLSSRHLLPEVMFPFSI